MFTTHKTFNEKFNRAEIVLMVLTALLTAIASEIKVVPFNGEDFRFGLGSVTFFLLILIRPPASLVRTGIITGITVVCFRLLGDFILEDVQIMTSIENHLPAFLFYALFALGLNIIKVENYKTFPFLLGAWGAGLEFIGNGAEHLVRYWFLTPHITLGFREWALLIGVALLRSYFVVGLYSSITISEQKRQMQEMLGVGSELYAETLYLQKSMNHIEQITVSSHDLYRTLKKENMNALGMQALLIAQEIHEVKKDSQRILSGLTKITEQQGADRLFLSDVLHLVVVGNEKYSELLKKNITFHLTSSIDFETDQQIPLLALLNNLTANAVESITDSGEIELRIFEESEQVCIMIKDSGKGIPTADVAIIFEPGYTTKFNDHGVAATGIGLSHVKEIIHTLGGQIHPDLQGEGTTFQIKIPSRNIRKEVE